MSEDNSIQNKLLLREVLNENIIRDALIFILLYLFILAQVWDSLLLLFFPILSFSFALFFRIISTNKKRLNIKKNLIQYNPIGLESKHADRFVFLSLIQLILLIWIGGESLYHPQLIDNFSFYFILAFSLIYSLGYFWIFIGIWNYCKLVIDLSSLDQKEYKLEKRTISELNFHKVQLISYLNLVFFIVLNLLNILFIILALTGLDLGFPYNLPGTGIEGSQPLYLPFTIFIILLVFPIMTVIFLWLIYLDVTSFSEINFKTKISNLPNEIQNQIIENLKTINTKLFEKSM
jgi:hypothetical protein